MKSKAAGCHSILTVFSSIVLLCVTSIIIIMIIIIIIIIRIRIRIIIITIIIILIIIIIDISFFATQNKYPSVKGR